MIKAYIKYRKNAKTRHGIHSPFIFDFQNLILRAKEKPQNLGRKNLLLNKNTFQLIDHGAGSRKPNSQQKISSATKKSSLPNKYAKLLHNIVLKYPIHNILEFGTHFGIGTLTLANAKKNTLTTSIEGCPNTFSIAKNHIEQFSIYDNITLINSTFDDYISDNTTHPKIDLFYLDGNHSYEATLRYLDFAKQIISDNGWIILDDIHWSDGMEKAWKEIISDSFFDYSIDLFRMGILIKNNQLRKQHFILKY